MSDDAAKLQVKGICKEISEKNGWTTFAIDKGSQYPVRLSTKLDALIKAGREAGQNEAVWTYTESEGGEIPNQPGKHYMNRRLEKVEVGGTVDPALATAGSGASSGTSTPSGGVRTGDERVSIERQTILKATLPSAPTGELETLADWWGFVGEIDAWMAKPRDGSAAPPEAAAPPPAAEPVSDTPPAYADDDIPF